MRNWLNIIFLVIVGSALYYHALFEPFKVDNIPQIVNQPLVHSLNHLPELFFGGMGYSKEHFDFLKFYYRPINMVLNAFLWQLGNGSTFPFHAFQIAIFIANGVLYYLLLLKFLGRSFAFASALLFLSSPTNMEVADYIAILQDTLYFFFGISALCLVVYKVSRLKVRFIFLYLLLLSALLSKETGILFILLLLLWAKLFDQKTLKYYLYICLFVIATYLILRFYAAQNVYSVLILSWAPSETLIQKLQVILSATRINLQAIVLPGAFNIQTVSNQNVSLGNALIGIGELITLGGVMAAAGALLKTKHKVRFRVFVFFCTWVLIGVIFHSQVFTLEAFVGLRWLYISVAGFYAAVSVVLFSFYKGTLKQKAFLLTIFFVVLAFFIFQHITVVPTVNEV